MYNLLSKAQIEFSSVETHEYSEEDFHIVRATLEVLMLIELAIYMVVAYCYFIEILEVNISLIITVFG
jgi:hypothetical protein